jgi:hypothetical protein
MIRSKKNITRACEEAGWPPPRFGPKFATIRIPLKNIRPKSPAMSAETFDAWCGELSHAGVARFINMHLETVYTTQDIWQMRRRKRPITARIRALVEDHDEPIDPKQEAMQ